MWDFQLKKTIIEAFDMIVEENNVPFVVKLQHSIHENVTGHVKMSQVPFL
jgi:hypothetical protein